MRLSHLILDRDGTLNPEAPEGGWITSPEQWRWLPGTLQALASLRESGVHLSVVTNQSCIGRRLATREAIDTVHERMLRECREAGGCIDSVWVCPHAPGAGCECRKPRPGLVLQAIAAAGYPAEETLLIGDDRRDLEAGLASGIKVALVRTGKGARTEANLPEPDIPVYDDLQAAVSALADR